MKSLIRFAVLTSICCLLSPAPIPAQEEAPPAPDDKKTYLFQVVLVIGDNTGGPSSNDVPKNAQNALDDIRDFLPFKNYRLLDTALLRSSHVVEGLLAGPDGSDYGVRINFDVSNFEGTRLHVRSFDMTAPHRDESQRVGRRQVLATSFSVDVGETLVVGSSKLDGSGKALIVLFTVVQ